jgi:hypothetical protein
MYVDPNIKMPEQDHYPGDGVGDVTHEIDCDQYGKAYERHPSNMPQDSD